MFFGASHRSRTESASLGLRAYTVRQFWAQDCHEHTCYKLLLPVLGVAQLQQHVGHVEAKNTLRYSRASDEEIESDAGGRRRREPRDGCGRWRGLISVVLMAPQEGCQWRL